MAAADLPGPRVRTPTPARPAGPMGDPSTAGLRARGDGASRQAPPSISLPKGGGAIRGIGEKFATNPVTGTGSLTVPIVTSAGRGELGPHLELAYDSGRGNGPFGFGWNVRLPSITRKTDKGLPAYDDATEADVFLLSDAEDLVPALDPGKGWARDRVEDPSFAPGYRIDRYRPRIEAAFARIERWTRLADGDVHWRSLTRTNVTTRYGVDAASRVADPADPRRVFSWLISDSSNDKGNAIVFAYKGEDALGVDTDAGHERGRERRAGRYLKRILYGNTVSLLTEPDLDAQQWLFEVVLDYGEHDRLAPTPHDA